MGRNKLAESSHPQVTLRTLAGELDVSPATVMRALNDRPGVTAALRRKIIQLARKRNYFPPDQSSRLAAIIIPGFQFSGYTGLLLSPLMKKLFEEGFYPEVISDCYLDVLNDHMYSGVISIVWNSGLEKRWSREHAIPMVVLNAKSYPTGGVWQVSSDEIQGVTCALEHLYRKGRRRIAFISTALKNNLNSMQRVQAFHDFCSRKGGLDFSFHDEYSPDKNLADIAEKIFRKNADAVFVACETYAHQFLSLITRSGRRIPEDIALIGLEYNIISPHTHPPMTTIAQDFDALAKQAVEQLIKQIAHDNAPREILVPYRLIERNTV